MTDNINKREGEGKGKGYVIFETETELDMRSITTFGLNAKPNTTSPIGYFGTGLKIAIAVLLRHDIPVKLRINSRLYEFYTETDKFRGAEYRSVRMKRANTVFRQWIHTDLPFTTELGKNWSLWQAFRELESNTRDENGITQAIEGPLPDSLWPYSASHNAALSITTWIIGPSTAFLETWAERDKIFLPEALKSWQYGDKRIQLFDQPSNYIYYRSIRVRDLKKPSIFTYNILKPIELTEDRTIKYEWDADIAVQEFLAHQDDTDLINRLLDATEDHYEASLSWDSSYATEPSAVFKDTLAKRIAQTKAKEAGLTTPSIVPRFTAYHQTFTPSEPTGPFLRDKFSEYIEAETKKGISDKITNLLQQVRASIPYTTKYQEQEVTNNADTDEIPF